MQSMDDRSQLLMLAGVSAFCTDCGDERVFLPVDGADADGGLCCTSCDAAVVVLSVQGGATPRRRVA